MKVCRGCGVEKSLSEYNKHPSTASRRQPLCRPCQKEVADAYRSANRERLNRTQRERYQSRRSDPVYWRRLRDRHLRRHYGVTIDEFEEVLAAQGGVCALCRGLPRGEKGASAEFHLDHCHVTGEFRGVLCNDCNRGIGLLRHDREIMERALEYIR